MTVQPIPGLSFWPQFIGLRERSLLSLLFIVLFFLTGQVYALGDGPRAYWVVPKDMNFLNPMWISLDSNHGLDDALVLDDAEFDTDIFALMYTRTLSVGGNLGGISVILPGGKLEGGLAGTAFQGESSGLGDLNAIGVVSLFGAPAMEAKEFSSFVPNTALDLLFAVTAPTGEYDADETINLGSNRWSFRFGMPFIHYFQTGLGKTTTLELQPSVTFFTKNDEVAGAVNELEQDPIYKLEAHLTHDFNPMFWGSIDALYTSGGETILDGIDQDNSQRSFQAGLTLGAYFSKSTGVYVTYGEVLSHNDNAQDGSGYRVVFKYIY
ncbi:transporter [Thiolapillus brandeum]|uniref:Transporter n=1 Tax=Thiolapillus brandeum TaxID=1076588 RepID=A0A7U6GIA5_9GAMM|nr:transporter [Thiolapillus brandeum]BAO44112.1 hypothetical protein TBH_C1187 [Thiolapillus brandeum]